MIPPPLIVTPGIRVRVIGILVRQEKILLIAYDGMPNGSGFHYNFPGGGLETGELLADGVRREMREEANCDVAVEGILALSEFAARDTQGETLTHSVNVLFQVSLLPGSEPAQPPSPDPYQVGVEWVPLDKLTEVRVYPPIAESLVSLLRQNAAPVPVLENARGQ
ncbi:MAG: hypothetical protein OHK0029_39850 [Armatimonadaceae bacterium]